MITRAVCRVLVGREDELSLLEDALLAACRGEGSVVVLAGDAGLGKTRLCTELAARAESIGATVMEGTCSEADLALPYLPFLEAIGNYLASVDTGELHKRLGVHARELASVFPQLGVETVRPEGEETTNARLRLFEAILALLGIAAEERGLLLIIEDLHWADASTRELLDYLTRRLRNRRMLLLCTYRRDEMHRKHPLLPTVQGWQRSRLAQIVELEPLEPDGVARMVSAIFDNTTVGNEFRDFIHARSEGNPFVLEEMLKAAIDRGDIYHDASDWQRKPIAELRIPQTVRDTILLRVERLEPKQAEILRFASVLGRSFDYRTLIAVSKQDTATVESALQTAVQQQLLEEESRGRYRFRHALTQEAIYDDLSAPTRERLHSAAADALAADAAATQAEIAFHLRHANRWDEAIPATMSAASAAEAGRGYDESAALYTLLLPVLTRGVERAQLLSRLGEAYFWAARPGKAIQPLEEGIRLLEASGLAAEAAHHRLSLGRCLWESGKPRLARTAYLKAREALEPAGPSRDLALACIRLAGLDLFDLDAAGCKRFAELALHTAEQAGAKDMRIWSLNFLGVATAFLGNYPLGVEYLESSATQALELGYDEIGGNALHNLIVMYHQNLEAEKLPDVARRLQSIGREQWRQHSRLFALHVYAHTTGDLEACGRWTREWLVWSEQFENQVAVNLAKRAMGIYLVDADRLPEARQYLISPSHETEVQDALADCWLWIRYHLAAGDLAAAVSAAEFLLTLPDAATAETAAAEAAVDAFAAAGRRNDLARITEMLKSAPGQVATAAGKVAQAHVALGDGNAEVARSLVREAIDTYDRAGYLQHACRARLFLADVQHARGELSAAEAELRAVYELANKQGLNLLARQSGERLAGLGVLVDVTGDSGSTAPYVPREVGERLVTVMFADVRGYTAMSAEQAPIEIVDKIATFQRWAAGEVERHHGVVDKFAGDALMATFNVAGTHVDHAERALGASIALRDKAGLLGLPIGIGIATGAAVVGQLTTSANVSVLGQATNLASRLQSKAAAGEILISEETERRLQSAPESNPERLELKGFANPVTAYRIAAPAKAPTG